MQPTVYLAGPISGCSYTGCTEWREVVKTRLAEVGVTAFSPMRAKEYLSHVKEFGPDGNAYAQLHGVRNIMSTNRGIMTRDRFDATTRDVLFVNLLGATRVSIGTVMEIAWADAHRIPIVCVMEDAGNPHEHGMVLEAIGFRVASIDEAIHVTKSILTPH